MSTYQELKAKAEALLREAEELRKQEIKGVIEEIRAKMAQFGITVEDLTGTKKRSRSRSNVIKFVGPNGEQWSGGPGRKPAWVRELIQRGEDIEKYRVAT